MGKYLLDATRIHTEDNSEFSGSGRGEIQRLLCFAEERCFRFHSTERGSGAARRAMGFLTRWLAGKMEDPAKRQADFEKHMTTTMAKCEEM